MGLPDSVWDAEKNYTIAHQRSLDTVVRQWGDDLTPPATACITIKAIYDRNWVQSSGGDGAAAVRAVLDEAQHMWRDKYVGSNQLGTSFTFNYEGNIFTLLIYFYI